MYFLKLLEVIFMAQNFSDSYYSYYQYYFYNTDLPEVR